jgi:hypothetical protein
MKKALFIFALIIPVFLLSPNKSFAQGTFNCRWHCVGTECACRINPKRINCTGDNVPGSTCRTINNIRDRNKAKTQCDAAKNLPCVKPLEPFLPSECFDCNLLTGIPRELCFKYPYIKTSLGCIPTYPTSFLYSIRTILLGVGGGIAFLLMIIGAFFILTSQGQPEQAKRGKEIFVGAIAGLLMMIFSVYLLELAGVDILGILRP